MPHKNSSIRFNHSIDDMPHLLYRMRYTIVIVFSMILLLWGCSKDGGTGPITGNLYQQYFEQNILNRDYRVKLATDNGTDLTAQYNGYTFRLLKNTLQDGPLTVSNSLLSYNGTWSCNDDYSKLVINLPSLPPEFVFLSREWRFTRKDFTIMELAPWGTTEPKVLHMERL